LDSAMIREALDVIVIVGAADAARSTFANP
jgi:hypothetical protein